MRHENKKSLPVSSHMRLLRAYYDMKITLRWSHIPCQMQTKNTCVFGQHRETVILERIFIFKFLASKSYDI